MVIDQGIGNQGMANGPVLPSVRCSTASVPAPAPRVGVFAFSFFGFPRAGGGRARTTWS